MMNGITSLWLSSVDGAASSLTCSRAPLLHVDSSHPQCQIVINHNHHLNAEHHLMANYHLHLTYGITYQLQ